MPEPLTNDIINDRINDALRIYSEMEEDIISRICERLSDLNNKSSEEIDELAKAAAMANMINNDSAYLKRRVNQANKKMIPALVSVLDAASENVFNNAAKYYAYRGIKIESVKNSLQMRQMIEKASEQVVDNLLNLSHTYAFDYGGKVQPIGKTYRDIVNKAVLQMRTGGGSLNQLMRSSVKELVDSGIKTIDWESGTVRRADGHIRMNIREGVNRLNNAIQKENARIYHADGVETSMHALCAPDHQEFQGQQYPLRDWERIEDTLQRPFGTLNCQHFVTYIIMGVSRPVYSEQERLDAIARSNQQVSYNGQQMSRYEAAQKQRYFERNIRKNRSLLRHSQEIGDASETAKYKNSLKQKITQYKDFSSAVGLRPRLDRTYYFV